MNRGAATAKSVSMVDAAATHRKGVLGTQLGRMGVPVAAHRRLQAYRRAVEQALPGLVEDVILFGSRARRTARRGSDYDVAVVLREYSVNDHMAIRFVLADAAYEHVVAGVPISPIPIELGYLQSISPLASEIARDGVSIQ